MAKIKKNSKISLGEFRAWLSGVEEMQDDDWAPSQSQWDTIRRKIDLIDQVDEIVTPVATPIVPHQQQSYPVPHQPMASSLSPAPPKPTSLQPAGNSPGSMKTPDIDTSSGDYRSSFT